MTRAQMLRYTAVTLGIALAAGAYLVHVRGEATLTLLGIGVFFVLFYTWPLKYIGLGEVAVILVWGPLMVGGGYYVITGQIYSQVLVASLPFALAATTVLFGKHIDKLLADQGKGIRTMPVLLGERNARYTTIALLTGQYLFVLYLIATGYFSPAVGVVALALPAWYRAVKAHAYPRPTRCPQDFPDNIWPLWYSAFVFSHTRRFGILFLVGLTIDVVIRRFGG